MQVINEKTQKYNSLPVRIPSIGYTVKEKGLGVIMKKFFSFVFAVLISMCAFTSCLAEDAYGLYTTVMDSVKDTTAFEGTYKIKVNLTAGGMNMGMTIDGNMQTIKRSETDADMAVNMKMDLGALGAGSNEMSMYIKDGWQYTNTAGEKIKQEISTDDESDTETLDPQTLQKLKDSVLSFDKSLIVSSGTAKAEGGKEISFELDGQKIGDAFMDFYKENFDEELDLDDFGSLLNGDADEDVNVALGNVHYSVFVDKDNVMYAASVSASIGAGEDYTVELQIDLSDLGFDSFTEIDFPDDLDEYSEAGDWFSDLDDDFNSGYDYNDDFDLYDDMTF